MIEIIEINNQIMIKKRIKQKINELKKNKNEYIKVSFLTLLHDLYSSHYGILLFTALT